MNTSQIARVTATGDITARDAFLRALVLTGGADASVVTIRSGGASGTAILTMKAAINTVVPSGDLHDVYCADGIHVTVDSGTTPAVTVIYV